MKEIDLTGKPVSRDFVKHRNDEAIPARRKVSRLDLHERGRGKNPLVSVIIPTADGSRHGYFPALLKQLEKQTFSGFEILVVQGDNRQGRAINTGAALARGKYLLTLDDDTDLSFKGSIGILVEAMEADSTIGMAGGINRVPENAPFVVRRAMKEIPRRSTPEVGRITDSDLAEHPLLMMRKDVFIQVGGENERMPRGLDPYLRHAFREAGTRVVVAPGAYYSHMPPARLGRLMRQFFRNGDQSAFCRRHYPQWLYDTPDGHEPENARPAPFAIRLARHGAKLGQKMVQGHLVYVLAYLSYGAGFVSGAIRYREGEGR